MPQLADIAGVLEETYQPCLRIKLFGSPQILDRAGAPISIRSRKAQAVLLVLAACLDQRVARSKLAGLLWDRVPEQQARKSLRQALTDLGAVLGPAFRAIETSRESLRLSSAAVEIDLEALTSNASVVAMGISGPFLDGLDGITEAFDEWLFQERSAKSEMVRLWHENQITSLVGDDAPAIARIKAARQLLAFDPTHERAWRTLIGGLADVGDIGQAAREYRACETMLSRVLDAEPSIETRRLWSEIKRSRPSPPATLAPDRLALPVDDVSGWQASIAMLPLVRLSTETRLAFLANGILEGVVHVLSGIGDLFVISRASVLKYADGRVEPREVGIELGVRYVLNGTISAFGRKVALYLELSEASSGRVMWTDRMRLNAIDLFETQDAVAAEIVAAIAPSVRANELARARRKPPSSLTAYDLLLQALDKLYSLDRPAFEEAGDYFQRAMKLDAGFAAVRSHAATWHNFRVAQGWSKTSAEDSAKAADLAGSALALDHNDATALSIQGQVMSFARKDYDRARMFLDRAIQVGPSCHLAWALSSATHGWTGDGAKAVQHAERALKLSPFDPFAYFAEHMISQGHYVNGEYEKAVFWGRRAADRNGRLTSNLRTLTASLVASGELAEALRVAMQVRKIEPKFDLDAFGRRTPFRPEIKEAHIERLREAGL